MRPFAAACSLVVTAAALSAQYFIDVTAGTQLAALPHATVSTGVGLACGDFDGDGDLDLITAENPGLPMRFFRNDGGMVFTDQTAGRGLGSPLGYTSCYAVGDIDNDGDLDLYVGVMGGQPLLYVNDGAGNFVEAAIARGIQHSTSNYSACFGDYDRDGWLDLYIGNHYGATGLPTPNILYRNVGGGQFVDVTTAAGVGDPGFTYAATFLDFDEDGWPDIVTANDRGYLLYPNNLYRNNGDGTFTSVAAQVGADLAIDGMGVDFTDAFADGGLDLFFSDSAPTHVFAPWNAGLGRYAEATATYGMALGGNVTGWAVNFLDFDNDGWQDVHCVHALAPNSLYHNPGQPAVAAVPWPDVAVARNVDQAYAQYTTIVGDFDGDGGLDLCERYQNASLAYRAPRGLGLLHNQVPRGNWLRFRLRGTVSNRDGIGARVVVVTGAHRQRQWVRSGTGFLGSSDLAVHFGLGTATAADFVEITWPSGQVQYLTHVVPNRELVVEEPSFLLRSPATVGGVTHLDLAVDSDAGLPFAMCLAMQAQPRTPIGDGRTLPLAFDDLSLTTLQPGNPFLPGSLGALDAQGRGSSPLMVPSIPALAGLTVYSTAATLDAVNSPSLLRTLFPRPLPITVQ